MELPLPPAVDFDRLPAELLGHILSMFKVRPRMLVLRLVCKRWSIAVLRSIRSLTPRKLCALIRARQLLPRCINLTTWCPLSHGDLRCLSPEQEIEVALRTRTLIMDTHYTERTAVPEAFTQHCTRLTSLMCSCAANASLFGHLLRSNANTLETLNFEVSASKATKLPPVHLPRLRELRITQSVAQCDFNLKSFLDSHVSSLTRLTLVGIAIDWKTFPAAPSLRSLTVLALYDATGLCAWLKLHTNVTELEIPLRKEDFGFLPQIAPILTRVTITSRLSVDLARDLADLLMPCAKLRQFDMTHRITQVWAGLHQKIGTRLHNLSKHDMLLDWTNYKGAQYSVRKLECISLPTPHSYLTRLNMPHLYSLTIRLNITLETLLEFVNHWKTLQSIWVVFCFPSPQQLKLDKDVKRHWPTLEAVLLQAERSGVQQLTLVGVAEPYQAFVRRAVKQFKWLRVSIHPFNL